MKSTRKAVVIIAAMVFAIATICFLLLEKDLNLIISYVCVCIGIAMWLIPALQADAKNMAEKMVHMSWMQIYMPVSIVISAIVMMLKTVAPQWHAIAQALPLAIVLGRQAMIGAAVKQAESMEHTSIQHDSLVSLAEMINAVPKTTKTEKVLKALYESVRYSDPVCPKSVISYQDMLAGEVKHLSTLSDEDEIICACSNISRILKERNDAIRHAK